MFFDFVPCHRHNLQRSWSACQSYTRYLRTCETTFTKSSIYILNTWHSLVSSSSLNNWILLTTNILITGNKKSCKRKMILNTTCTTHKTTQNLMTSALPERFDQTLIENGYCLLKRGKRWSKLVLAWLKSKNIPITASIKVCTEDEIFSSAQLLENVIQDFVIK